MESFSKLLCKLGRDWPSPKPAPFNLSAWLEPDERALNRLLADLFDPAGSHGMGDAFLRPLLKRIGHSAADSTAGLAVEMRVDAPVTCANRSVRMVDIQIKIEDHGSILLENKPWAAEQERQLDDYGQFALRESGWLVFLPAFPNRLPDSLAPGTEGLLRMNGRFVVLAYADDGPSRPGLISLLEGATKAAKGDHLAWAMDDILRYLRREVLHERENEMEDAQWLADHLSTQDYATAQRLAAAWPHMRGVHLRANLTCLAQSAAARANAVGLPLSVRVTGKGLRESDWSGLRNSPLRPPAELVHFMDFSVGKTAPSATIRLEYGDLQWSGAKLTWQDRPGEVVADAEVAQLLRPLSSDWSGAAGQSDARYVLLTPKGDAFCGPTSPVVWSELARCIVQALDKIRSRGAATHS